MGRRTFYTTVRKLTAWLERQIEPVKWAKAIETGRYEDDAWKLFSSIPELPRGVKLFMRPVNGKNGVFVQLDSLPEEGRSALMATEEAALRRRAAALDEREKELNNRELQLLEYSRRAQMEIVTIGAKQDARTQSMVSNLQAWERAISERAESSAELLKDLDEAMQRATDAEALNETAASLTYMADKFVSAATLWRVRKWEGLPADLEKDFQEYLQDRASRRFFLHLPNGPRKWANSFMQLSTPLRNETMAQITAALQFEAQQKRAQAPAAAPPPRPPAVESPAAPAPAGAAPDSKPPAPPPSSPRPTAPRRRPISRR